MMKIGFDHIPEIIFRPYILLRQNQNPNFTETLKTYIDVQNLKTKTEHN